MNDDNGFDDAGFAQFLMKERIVKPGTEKYFVHWVRSFHQNQNRRHDHPWYDQLPLFLESLKKAAERRSGRCGRQKRPSDCITAIFCREEV